MVHRAGRRAACRSPRAQRLSQPVGEYFLFTLAAQLTTLPLILYYFQRFSLVSLMANPLVLPAQPPVMILGGLAALLGMVFLPLGQLVAYLAWPFIVYTIRVVELLARLPGAAWTLAPLTPWAGAGFLRLAVRLDRFWRAPCAAGPRPSWARPALVWPGLAWRAGAGHGGGLAGGAGRAGWSPAPDRAGGRRRRCAADPDAGRAQPAGRRRRQPQRRCRTPWDAGCRWAAGRLDYLIVAAAGEEQLAALPRLVERFPPGQVLWSGPRGGRVQRPPAAPGA